MTFAARLMGKTAAETVSAIMAIFKRLDPRLRGSITFDNGSEFARHEMLHGLLSATTYFCDAYASWQKGGVENTNGRLRRWMPRETDLDDLSDEDVEQVVMTMNLTPRKCLGFKTPIEAFLNELGSDIQICFNGRVALRV
jgi:IS30 family transposase